MRLPKALADIVQMAAERAVEQRAPAWFLAKVTVVNSNGTVDISTARGPVAGVRRLKSYSAPAVNDVVKVSRNADGNWIVDGALA
ncbi:hypothetical protein AB0F77_39480 [Streptomyces sp. NPDC026672]|uniref:hypothetical protein n=1 Tax=Actinomycetes TaxID=1760 RepID=UPI0033FCE2AE